MQYSDITPRTNAYADRVLLERAKNNNILGQFGLSRQIPTNASKTIIERRYERLSPATQLTEGVTPTGKINTKTDISITIVQFGDWVGITDVILDTHEDPILNENLDILGEQAGDTIDLFRAGFLKAGTNLMYTNGTQRDAVNTVVTRAQLRTAIRLLKKQLAQPIKEMIKAGPNISTVPIMPAFVMVCHSDAQPDLEQLDGWVPISKYPSTTGLLEGEAGSIGEIRIVFDNTLTPWADGGGNKGNTLSTTGTKSDVYPLLIFGKNAYVTVGLAGKGSVKTYVNNPKATVGDELAQKGSVGWKAWTGGGITNDLWMIRIETALNG